MYLYFYTNQKNDLRLAAGTAVVGLFVRLGLPDPWTPVTSPTPLIIYGGASAVGAFAIKLARRANVHPIIAVAGRGISYVETLIDSSKGDTIIDYRKGNEAVVEGIKKVLQEHNLSHAPYAFDAVAQQGSVDNIAKVLDPQGGHTTFVLPHDKTLFPSTVHHTTTMVGSLHQDQPSKDLGYVYFRYIAKGLDEGWFSGHPFQVRENGLEGVQGALQDLKDGKASAVKYVFRIADTPKLKAGL
jgi:NADPH2:quinone reductase